MSHANYYNVLDQTRMIELQGRAEHVAKVTGKAPLNWYEFKQEQEVGKKERKNGLLVALLFGVVGAGIMGIMGMFLAGGLFAATSTIAPLIPVVMALAGGMIGGTIGATSKPLEYGDRRPLLDKYENYLNEFEQSAGRGRAVSQ